MKLYNLTPHTIVLMDEDNNVLEKFEPFGGLVARAAQTKELIEELSINDLTIPVYRSKFGKVENLPEPQEGHGYIVSALTAQAVQNRDDVFITMDPVRDEQGRIVGCRALGKI